MRAGGGAGVPHGDVLAALAEAIATGAEDVGPARDAVRATLGDAAAVDAVAVAANFQMMVRIADSTGIPLDAPIAMISQDVRAEMALDQFTASANTPALSLPQRAAGRAVRSALRVYNRISRRLGSR